MPRYLDTRGNSKIAIAVCARCGVKYPWVELSSDPNSPGLMVCPDGCKDEFDPYRLAARESEDITLEWARPDVSLSPGPMNVPVLPITAVLSTNGLTVIADASGGPEIAIAGATTPIAVAQPWGANQQYPIGAQVTTGVEYGPMVSGTNPQKVFLCVVPGQSGPSAPSWNRNNGSLTTDNTVTWMCEGVFLP